jgi:hypothetical protein
MLIGDINASVGNNSVTNLVGTNGEVTLNKNGKRITDFYTFNNLKIINTFLSTKKSINSLGKREDRSQLLVTL